METLVVIFGHGSKASEHNQGLQQVAAMVKDMTELPVECAYMENCQPDLSSVIHSARARGYKRFIVMPFFLFKGVHVAKDVPAEIEAIKQELPDIQISFARHLGADLKLAQMVVERVQEVI